METKFALITGITGQDGCILAQYLLEHNYSIIAPTRNNPDKSNLEKLGIKDNSKIKFVTYTQWTDFDAIISQYKPDEFYHFAAMSHVGQSHENPAKVFDVNVMWTNQILQSIVCHSKSTRFFFASSCEIFKHDIDRPVVEVDEKLATNPYGISKLAAHSMVKYYRETKGLYATNGILFNHESELRHDDFVSKKICREVARIVKHGGKPLMLGNIDAKKDWGYAFDYMKIIHSIMQLEKSDDFIVSTGQLCSVKDMVVSSFKALKYDITWSGAGLDTTAHDDKGNIVVAINEKYFRPLDNRFLCGDNQKTQQKLTSIPLTPFAQWVKKMTVLEYNKL